MWTNPSIWIPCAVIGIGFLIALFGTIRATKFEATATARRSGIWITGAGFLTALAATAALLITN